MRELLIVLFGISFALPTIGFVRLLVRAQREVNRARKKVAERGGSEAATLAEFNEQNGGSILDAPRALRRDLLWDTTLVGIGLAAGAAAGILPLFIAVPTPS